MRLFRTLVTVIGLFALVFAEAVGGLIGIALGFQHDRAWGVLATCGAFVVWSLTTLVIAAWAYTQREERRIEAKRRDVMGKRLIREAEMLTRAAARDRGRG